MTVGERVRQLMERERRASEIKLEDQDFAARAGMAKSEFSKLKNDKIRRPSPQQYAGLARCFSMTTAEFLGPVSEAKDAGERRAS